MSECLEDIDWSIKASKLKNHIYQHIQLKHGFWTSLSWVTIVQRLKTQYKKVRQWLWLGENMLDRIEVAGIFARSNAMTVTKDCRSSMISSILSIISIRKVLCLKIKITDSKVQFTFRFWNWHPARLRSVLYYLALSYSKLFKFSTLTLKTCM